MLELRRFIGIGAYERSAEFHAAYHSCSQSAQIGANTSVARLVELVLDFSVRDTLLILDQSRFRLAVPRVAPVMLLITLFVPISANSTIATADGIELCCLK